VRAPELSDFGDILWPTEAAEPILARPVRSALTEWLTEIWAEEALRAVGIGPRKRAIFDGPPGVGKTTLAHHLSARLGLPMLAVRPERLISKWLGDTAKNIGELFDCACAGVQRDGKRSDATPVVMFLDEFDAVAITRRRADHGAEDERNAYVNTLLQRIEQHDGFLIAATNFGKHIDPAIWRRFDMHITLELPGQPERERILARYLAPFGLPANALAELSRAFETASPALMRAFCESLKRQIVVGPLVQSDMRISAVFERVLASVQPHPDAGKPRLWNLGSRDGALLHMPWPLPLADTLMPVADAPEKNSEHKVVALASMRP
jgi:SpoVK/Ycf46/Vps4 family AAA+-type ATPase